ncbi:MAG TPA: substrate-binding domain-containing protein [bacterium]|nr:substrate-binding domain-containing protein [bacterium]
MPTRRAVALLPAFALVLAMPPLLVAASCKARGPRPLLLVTTTTTQDSGLLDRLVPAAERALGRRIDVVALGSGEALKHAERGDADVLIAHSPAAEEAVEKAGHVVDRAPLMWNRFFVIGPAGDPARVREAVSAVNAFRRIRAAGAIFVSRGDQSGTHKKEQEIWAAAGLPATDAHVLATGQGQGETVLLAAEKSAYALCDSSTWTRMHVAGTVILFDPSSAPRASGPSLVNAYHVMRENPALHPSTDAAGSKVFEEWVLGPDARAILSSGGLFTAGAPPQS